MMAKSGAITVTILGLTMVKDMYPVEKTPKVSWPTIKFLTTSTYSSLKGAQAIAFSFNDEMVFIDGDCAAV